MDFLKTGQFGKVTVQVDYKDKSRNTYTRRNFYGFDKDEVILRSLFSGTVRVAYTSIWS